MKSYVGWLIALAITIICIVSSFFAPKTSSAKNYSLHYDISKSEKDNFLILDFPQERGYVIAHISERNGNMLSFKLSKYLYKYKYKAEDLIEKKGEVFSDDFYLEAYYETTLDELRKKCDIKGVYVDNGLKNNKSEDDISK